MSDILKALFVLALRYVPWRWVVVYILWRLGVSELLAPYITPLSQCIIIMFYFRAKDKWDHRGRVAYREENWAQKVHSRVSFKTVWFFPIWLLFCWLARENTWYLISYLYLAQLWAGMYFPRIEYRITKDTPEGWALREYAKTEFSEEKMEQKIYALLYQEHLRYKKHEYYWWWQMQGEPWIFRIKAFSQFTRDIIFCILILILAIILGIVFLPAPIPPTLKFSMYQLNLLDIFFTTYGLIAIYAWLYLMDVYSHRYHGWNYFFYYDRYKQAAGPRKENPGTWEYYYYIITGIFPEKYRDLQDEQDRERLKKEHPGRKESDIITEEEQEGDDDLIGASDVNIDDYDATGGEDRSADYAEEQRWKNDPNNDSDLSDEEDEEWEKKKSG